ncbi:MAG: hypothetical protein UZ17_ACD001001328 [Acidobacteria bacterium OLB17]|nr:MAG: hypothetical protein UZ17_ACD001001328 [Acidobacteria bacterium OLB17]MCZ2391723.1 hypothetical protein [Acidobacteriota bacterium]
MERKSKIRAALKTLTAIALSLSILSGTFIAQPRRASTPGKTSKTPVKAGWSGIITYRKTLEDTFSSDEKVFGRVDESERIKHLKTRNYQYSGRIVVNDIAGTGRAATNAKVSIRDNEYHKVMQNESTNCHSWEPSRMIKSENTDRKLTEGTGSGEAVSYSLSVNGENFRLSFGLPAFQAKYIHTEATTYSNLCANSTRKPSNSTNTTDTKIPSGGTSIEGKIDPKNPDILEGSKTWSDPSGNIKGFTHTVTWKLRRKPQPLMITDIKFYQPIYPSPTDWREIPDDRFAVDGNQVKVVATVANLGSTDKTATVNFKELKENTDLPDGAVSATIPANGQKDVELIWDTSGYAWRQSGGDPVPESIRSIQATIPDDSMKKDLKVIPKPVIVVWGFWQWPSAMRKFRSYFSAVTQDWALSDGMTDVRMTSTENVDQLDGTIRRMQKKMNAWHVDLVAVQNGGLTARVYVHGKMPTQFDGRPTATHLVMVGVPNLGTPCASGVFGLSFKLNTLNWDAVAELSTESMKRFNLLVNNTNGTRFAALAIHTRNSICQEDVPGDGFAPIRSAIWRTKVNAVLDANVHTRDIMGEVAHFRQVFRWIAIPPKGDHSPDPATLGGTFTRPESFFRNAAYAAGSPLGYGQQDEERKPSFSGVALLRPGSSTEFEIPVKSGSRLSVVFFASPDITADLLDENGNIVASSKADSIDAMDIFRTITLKRPISAGKWKLRLDGRVASPVEVPVVVYNDTPETDRTGNGA